MKHIESAREVIDALGGIKAVSALTGRKTTTVSAWQAKFDGFPPNTYILLTSALALKGFAAPAALWGQIESGNHHDCEVA